MVLEVKNLCKSYGKNKILENVSFNIDNGEILGFLGPNGAGKTTTIKIITDSVRANSGEVVVCGYNIRDDRNEAMRNIGAVVESPECYGYLTGRQNLEMMAKIRKISKERVNEVIEFVKLKDRIDDKVKKYSLGMKQRLGIAIALLSKPKLLILDEPTNGLDPSGISEFRILLKSLVKDKSCSILISSHQLTEIENIASKVVFINKGKITSTTDINSLLNEDKTIHLVTEKSIENRMSLGKINEIIDFSETCDGYLLKIKNNNKGNFEIIKQLVQLNVKFDYIYQDKKNLEDKYFEIIDEN